jgi:hypothetical protein
MINLSYLGELWHNVPKQQVLYFSYSIDNTTNSTFSPGLSDGTTIDSLNGNPVYSVTNLNVIFPTNSDTISVWPLTSDQVSSLAVTNLVITNWPPHTTLWLVWQANTLGSAQDVAIDNLSFSASVPVVNPILPVTITPGSIHLVGSGASAAEQFSFTNVSGLSFSIRATNNLAAPKATWPVIGTAVENPAGSGSYQFTDPNAATNATRFYLLSLP